MIELVKALATGFVAGVVFALVGLPIPAPSVLAGIMGIVGIYVGYLVVTTLK